MISLLLSEAIERYAARLIEHPLMLAAKSGTVPASVVSKYLSSILYLVQHTPAHLRLASRSAAVRGSAALAAWYRVKLREETGHDAWAEQDLRVMSDAFRIEAKSTPCAAIVSLVADIERLILRAPAAYLSYILFSEYITVLVGPAWVAALNQHCGIPAAALTVVSNHAELDREHVQEGRQSLEHLLALEDREEVFAALDMAMRHFTAFCDELALQLGERAA